MTSTQVRVALVHRCQVARGTEAEIDGIRRFVWAVVAEDVLALVDSQRAPLDPTFTDGQQAVADRQVTILTLPTANIQPNDRLTVTRGPSGRYSVKFAHRIPTMPHGISHVEWRAESVV